MEPKEMENNKSLMMPGSIFSQPWWLDAVAPNSWDEVVIEKGGIIVARMPLVEMGGGNQHYSMPPLTQTLGPWFDLGEGKLTTRLARHKELANELISKIPEDRNFLQNFHYNIDNWLPWHWAGFDQTTRYTYVLEKIDDLDRLMAGMESRIRKELRKAEKKVKVIQIDDVDRFLDLNQKVFNRQGMDLPYTRDYVSRLHSACLDRAQSKIFLAVGDDGKDHAAIYLIWDDESAYYLMGGSDPELRNSGANTLCMWEAIQFASRITRKFDFEGSMIEPIERYFRGFGATPKAYHQISRRIPAKDGAIARVRSACKIMLRGVTQ
jgi:hypothetical protein